MCVETGKLFLKNVFKGHLYQNVTTRGREVPVTNRQ